MVINVIFVWKKLWLKNSKHFSELQGPTAEPNLVTCSYRHVVRLELEPESMGLHIILQQPSRSVLSWWQIV